MGKSFILPAPPVVRQHTRETCWAACIASIVNAAVSRDAAPWYGGAGAGSVTPLDSQGVVSLVKEKEVAAGRFIHPVTGALKGEGWKAITQIFGLDGPEFGFTPGLASGLIGKLPFLLTQQNYVVLFFTRPEWGSGPDGQPFFHARVIHGYFEGPPGSRKMYFRGMDPDPLQPDFIEEHFDPSLKYIASWRHAALPGP